MDQCSIFDDVLGPVMHGPSSSHSAVPCRIGYLCQSLLLSPLRKAVVYFDPKSSYASTYKFHCSDRGFTAGLLGIRYEMARSGKSWEDVPSMMSHIMDVMHYAAYNSTQNWRKNF